MNFSLYSHLSEEQIQALEELRKRKQPKDKKPIPKTKAGRNTSKNRSPKAHESNPLKATKTPRQTTEDVLETYKNLKKISYQRFLEKVSSGESLTNYRNYFPIALQNNDSQSDPVNLFTGPASIDRIYEQLVVFETFNFSSLPCDSAFVLFSTPILIAPVFGAIPENISGKEVKSNNYCWANFVYWQLNSAYDIEIVFGKISKAEEYPQNSISVIASFVIPLEDENIQLVARSGAEGFARKFFAGIIRAINNPEHKDSSISRINMPHATSGSPRAQEIQQVTIAYFKNNRRILREALTSRNNAEYSHRFSVRQHTRKIRTKDGDIQEVPVRSYVKGLKNTPYVEKTRVYKF